MLTFLWIVRMPHGDTVLRLAVERLDGPGTGQVLSIGRVGLPTGLPTGWESASAFISHLMFDSGGCWRVHDLDGSDGDAVVLSVRPP